MRPVKIVSGGQTGGDQGGLFAARSLGIPTGGWAPQGYRTDAGPAPWLADFGLLPTPEADYVTRTLLNVESAHVTLIFGDMSSPGCRKTWKHAQAIGRPWFHIPYPAKVNGLLSNFRAPSEPYVLNVAGNRERTNPGITAFTLQYLQSLFYPKVYTPETAHPELCCDCALPVANPPACDKRAGPDWSVDDVDSSPRPQVTPHRVRK